LGDWGVGASTWIYLPCVMQAYATLWLRIKLGVEIVQKTGPRDHKVALLGSIRLEHTPLLDERTRLEYFEGLKRGGLAL